MITQVFNRFVFAALLCFFFQFASAQCPTCTTTCTATLNGGNWSNASTWNGTAPSTCNCFTIPANLTVNVSTNVVIAPDAKITVAGVLNFGSNRDLTLTANSCIDIPAGGLVTGGNGQTVLSIGTASVPGPLNFPGSNMLTQQTLLPIELAFFEARKAAFSTKLRWATVMEINSNRFDVERSADGETFETLGSVGAAGDSRDVLDYDFVDEKPLAGSNFYRLRMIDLDGSSEFSPLAAVQFSGAKNWSIAQADGSAAQAFLETEREGEARFEVFDLAGRQLLAEKRQVEKGENRFELDFSNLPSGAFLAVARVDGEAAQTVRFFHF